MHSLARYPVPAVGTKGSYKLVDPFKTFDGELFECIGVRALASFISNNDDALQEVYLDNGLTEQNYEADLNENIEIVSLQNDKGFVLHVPAKYVSMYPVQDGVHYRAIAFNVFLPAMPVERDYSFLIDRLKETVRSQLGVDSTVTLTETSRVQQVSHQKHEETTIARTTVIANDASPFSKIALLERELAAAKQRVQVLEAHIKSRP